MGRRMGSCEIFPDLGYLAWEDFRTCGLRWIQQKYEKIAIDCVAYSMLLISRYPRKTPPSASSKNAAWATVMSSADGRCLAPGGGFLPRPAVVSARGKLNGFTLGCQHGGLEQRLASRAAKSYGMLWISLDWERFQVAIVDGSGPEGDAENKPLMNQESLRRMVFLSGEAERSRVFLYEVAGWCPCMLLLASVFRRSVGRTLYNYVVRLSTLW